MTNHSKILMALPEIDTKKPTWLAQYIFDYLVEWYKEHIRVFEACPTVADLIDNYREILVESYIESQIDLETSENPYEEATDIIWRGSEMDVNTLEDLVSDMYLIAGLTFEVDPFTDGFIMDTDLIVSRPGGQRYLSPQIPLFKILEATGEAYIRPGLVRNMITYLNERSVLKREYHNLY